MRIGAWRRLDIKQVVVIAGTFWYLSLFPGILGPDNSVLVRKIQVGESTDQWTAIYFKLIQILTFNGRFIYLASLFFLILYSITLCKFVRSLPVSETVQKRSLFIFVLTPFYGVFGVSIGHDLTFVCGLLIVLRLWIISHSIKKNFELKEISFELLGLMLLATHASGYPVVIVHIALRILFHGLRYFGLVLVFVLAMAISSVGVKSDQAPGDIRLLLAEVKCIVQDENADVAVYDWNYLKNISPVENWLLAVPCDDIDKSVIALGKINYKNIDRKDLFTQLASLASRNIPTFAMSRIAKSSPVLPPLFFSPPPNGINTNFGNPIGYNSAQDLSVSAGVFHPSVDEPSVDYNIGLLKPLWAIAQGTMLITNQASWFWGWGGLWIFPFMALLMTFKSKEIRIFRFSILSILFSNWFFLTLLMPAPSPRYAMHYIILGILSTIIMVNKFLYKNKS